MSSFTIPDPNLSDKSVHELFKIFLKLFTDIIVCLAVAIYFWLEALFRFVIPTAPKSLKGEIILVTGAGNGIGRQICLQLANQGAILVCWDIHDYNNKSNVDELRARGTKAFGYQVDVSDIINVKEAALKVKQEVGDVTIIINNAGIMVCKKLLSMTSDDFQRTFQINLMAHFWILQEFLPKMLENNHGHVVALASACGMVPSHNIIAYNASKAAVIMYMESLKIELRNVSNDSNIHLTTVYPIGCNTDMLNGLTCSSRPGVPVPLVTPEYVARCLINGLKRNYEHVYVPGILMMAEGVMRWIPSKVLSAVVKYTGAGVAPEVQSNQKLMVQNSATNDTNNNREGN